MANQGQFISGAILTAAELNAFTPMTIISRSTNQTVTSGVQTFIAMNTEVVDVLNWHSTITNTERITPTIAGYYMCVGSGTYDVAIGARVLIQLTKNGTEIVKFDWVAAGSAAGSTVSQMVYLNGSTDYVELATYQFSGSSQPFTNGSLQVFLVRAA